MIRNIENSVKTRLQRRAKRHGHSMEEEVRDILRSQWRADETASGGLGTEMSRLFAKIGLSEDVPELHGHAAVPAEFEP